MTCPFDFLLDFEGWFAYHKCIHFDKLTPDQARRNVTFAKYGWVLVNGLKYGMWTHNGTNAKN